MPVSETPKIVTRVRRAEPVEQKDFTFSPDMVRLTGSNTELDEYRHKAWQAFKDTALPDTRMEAWRRTDLKDLHPEVYRLRRLTLTLICHRYPSCSSSH